MPNSNLSIGKDIDENSKHLKWKFDHVYYHNLLKEIYLRILKIELWEFSLVLACIFFTKQLVRATNQACELGACLRAIARQTCGSLKRLHVEPKP